MKKIEAIIRPESLDAIRTALEEKGIVSMTVAEVQGRGRQKGISLQWRAGEYCVEFLPKLRLDMIVDDKDVETAINSITEAAKTGYNGNGKYGDGKIFIYPVEEVVRVSTGERGKEAI
ncbi:nitrogen regulatory protein PII [Candidatus Methanoperedens nitroreducens]|uniref:Nitrogen regulatory protein PII n=1 Tax=Candidatus Methanoperedens nitratireducens TaxID=1392998 RepID=A0A062UZA0_9EURY|nr:P-II family nitrogen regulator [Candidatus Methanoperedens nitroreducens]KCZ72261.1 nitrogen regulatory protein PII [Candidatus Methanoperedens nitroreducens]MDJ1421762.1 P-II family nitrogen regulator [Candidatus Methanoperedens sp.]